MTPAPSLVDQRCWHHPGREAVVRCPRCRRFYCRECVTEHMGRMMCAACVAQATGKDTQAGRFASIPWIAMALGGLLLAWLIFYYLGVFLARIPSDFFEGPA
jgi:hypothetical protein